MASKKCKDSGSRLHSKLKEAIMKTGMEKNLFGNHRVSLGIEARSPPPAFASEPLAQASRAASLDIVEIDGGAGSETSSLPNHEPSFMKSTSPSGAGAATRKSALQFDRQNSEISYYADDDEDGNKKKYARRGTFLHKFLRSLVPFWSSALPTLPVTAPPRKDVDDASSEGRTRHHRSSSRMDPRKILLVIAIMACMATMGILYYRIAQRGLVKSYLMMSLSYRS